MEEKAGILVFGAEYSKIGKMDKDLISRLAIALRLWKNNQNLSVIVTGGTHHPTENRPIAKDMKEWLLKKGVSEDKICMEDRSYNSWTNLINSLSIIKDKKWMTVFLVSNKIHLIRIRFYIWRLRRKDALLKDIVFISRASEHLDFGDFVWEAIAWTIPLGIKRMILLRLPKYRHLR